MKLSIITPIYNTPDELITRYFDSLKHQATHDLDVEVIIVNDGGEPSNYDFNNTPYPTIYLEHPHNMGPGVARQTAIDAATGDFICFCDSDDCFLPTALQILSQNLYLNCDVSSSKSIKLERMGMGEVDGDRNFPDDLHGLCIRRQFLIDNNIRFLDDYYHEDGFFTLKCRFYNARLHEFEQPVIRHYQTRWESLATFRNADIYDISLIYSVINLFRYFDRPQILPNPSFQDTVLYSCFAGRLNTEIRKPDGEGMQHAINTFLSCIWFGLDAQLQDQIRQNCKFFQYYADPSLYLNEAETEIINLCANDNENIKNYLFTCLNRALDYFLNIPLVISEETRCSVIVPSFNTSVEQKQFLIDSINKQTACKNMQLIIVDDGSFANYAWTEEYLNENLQCPHILHTLPENHGVGYARKVSFDLVNTDYFIVMDADDGFTSPDTVQQYISILDMCNLDGVNSYIRAFKPSGSFVITEGLYIAQSLHGFCGRTKVFRDHGIEFKPLQYVEDGLFIAQMRNHNLQISTVPIIGYERRTGYLTNNVESTISNLNAFNDYYNLIRYLAKDLSCPICDNQQFAKTTIQNIAEILTEIPFSDKEYNLAKTLNNCRFEDEGVRENWKLYYIWVTLKSLSPELLQEIKHTHANLIYSIPNLTYYIDEVLLNAEYIHNSVGNYFISFEDLEHACHTWLDNYIARLRQQSPNAFVPPQVLKNFPWNYKTYLWRA